MAIQEPCRVGTKGRFQFRVRTLLLLPVAVAILIGIPQWFIREIKRNRQPDAQEFARRCQLKQISSLMQIYAELNGKPPPACTFDNSGRRVHSWRALILPRFHDRSTPSLQFEYDYSMPWDQGGNATLADTLPETFDYPVIDKDLDWKRSGHGSTSYVAIVDSDDRKAKQTILAVVEFPDSDIHWTEPRDLTVPEFLAILRNPDYKGSDGSRSTLILLPSGRVDSISMESFRLELFQNGNAGLFFDQDESRQGSEDWEDAVNYYKEKGSACPGPGIKEPRKGVGSL